MVKILHFWIFYRLKFLKKKLSMAIMIDLVKLDGVHCNLRCMVCEILFLKKCLLKNLFTEYRLKAELQVINECDLKTLPESREIQLLVLHQEQIQHIEQLEETLTFLRAKRTEVMAELKQEEESHSLLQSVNEVLKVCKN